MKELSVEEIVKCKKKEKYSRKNYKSSRNCIPVVYNGKEYKSKAQCIALEKISYKELNTYLNEHKED